MSNKTEKRKDNDARRKNVEHDQKWMPPEKSCDEFSEIARHFHRTRSALAEGNETLRSLLISLTQKEKKEKTSTKESKQHSRIALIESVQHDLHKISNAVDQAEEELKSLEKRMNEKNEEVKKTRKAVFEKDEELKSLYDRVAGDVASSIKTGKAINLNNPVSKPRIIELYEDLRWNWPKIKSSLKSKGGDENSSRVRHLMQTAFYQAKAEMTEKMNHIDEVFELNMARSDKANSKVKEYRQLTIQNLQLAIYSEKQQDLKNPTTLRQCDVQDVEDYLKHECFWLGRLMALNDPPLEPDWVSPPTTYDKWDILPHNITESPKYQENISEV